MYTDTIIVAIYEKYSYLQALSLAIYRNPIAAYRHYNIAIYRLYSKDIYKHYRIAIY